MTKFEKEYIKEVVIKLEMIKECQTCKWLFEEVIEKLKEIIEYDDQEVKMSKQKVRSGKLDVAVFETETAQYVRLEDYIGMKEEEEEIFERGYDKGVQDERKRFEDILWNNDIWKCDVCGEYSSNDYVRYSERFGGYVCDSCIHDHDFQRGEIFISHKDRSVANSRCEARKIYNQRRYINKLQQELEDYKSLVENLKELDLYESFLDYDYEDNSFIDYVAFDMDYYVDNWFKVSDIERGEDDETI